VAPSRLRFRFLLRLRPAVALALLLAGATASAATVPAAPQGLEPEPGAVLSVSIPHLAWSQVFAPQADAMPEYRVQIAHDAEFTRMADEDRIAGVITRYVPDRELPPGDYWWRVAGCSAQGESGRWSAARRFIVQPPERVFSVPLGATHRQILDLLAQAAAAAPATLRFLAATYRVALEGESLFPCRRFHDLVIDGNGATVVITTRPKPSYLARLEGCQRIQIKNFTFDCDPPPETAARVLVIDRAAGSAEVEVLPGFPLYEELDRAGFEDKAQRGAGALLRNPATRGPKEGAPVLLPAEVKEKLAGRRYRIAPFEAAQLAEFAVGDIFVRAAGRSGNGFQIGDSDQVVLNGLTLYATPGIGFQSDHTNRLSIIGCRLLRRPERFQSVPNGGHNHHNARIGPWVEGCTFEAVGDDTLHVNATVIYLRAKLAANCVRLDRDDVQPGDRLQFWDMAHARLVSERRVTASRAVGRDTEVTLDGDVGAVEPSRRSGLKTTEGTQVYNVDAMCNQFVWRHNVARDGLRNGLVLKGTGGLVEDNRFTDLGGSGIHIGNTPFEGLAAADYVIRRNVIENCGLLSPRNPPPSLHVTFLRREGATPLHRNLLIADNVFRDNTERPIEIQAARGVVITGNRFENSARLVFRRPVKAAIQLSNVHGAVVRENVTTDSRLSGLPLLSAATDCTDVRTKH
jgi:hypothetical protein